MASPASPHCPPPHTPTARRCLRVDPSPALSQPCSLRSRSPAPVPVLAQDPHHLRIEPLGRPGFLCQCRGVGSWEKELTFFPAPALDEQPLLRPPHCQLGGSRRLLAVITPGCGMPGVSLPATPPAPLKSCQPDAGGCSRWGPEGWRRGTVQGSRNSPLEPLPGVGRRGRGPP